MDNISITIITTILLSAGIIVTTNLMAKREAKKKQKENKSNLPSTPIASMDDLLDMLHHMSIQISDASETDKNRIIARYQGGTFVMDYKQNYMDIFYLNFMSIKFAHFNQATQVANQMNSRYSGWTCYLSVNKDEGENEYPVDASLSLRHSLRGPMNEIEEDLYTVLDVVFHIARDFSNRMEESIKRDDMSYETFVTNDFANNIAYHRNKLELEQLNNQNQQPKPEDGEMTLAYFYRLFEDKDWGAPLELKVHWADHIEMAAQGETMMEFDLYTYIKEHHQDRNLSFVEFDATFEKGHLTIAMQQQKGSNEKSLFYRAVATRLATSSPLATAIDEDCDAKMSLIEIRLTTEKENYWEARYMLDEVMEKRDKVPYESLSDQEKALLAVSMSTEQIDAYWAMKYYNSGCYFQSAFYFRRIFSVYNRMWHQLSEEQRSLYYKTSAFLGFIYMELNLTDKAFYYLNIAKESFSVTSIEEYVNCLCRLSDPKAMTTIVDYKKSIEKLMGDEENADMDNLVPFYNFLNRRITMLLVEQQRYHEAVELLQQMIKDGFDEEFAKKELEYVNQLIKESKTS